MAVRVKEGVSFDTARGEQVNLRRGQLFPDDHPYVKGREHLFEPADDAAARSAGVPVAAVAVETATAAPGERRSVTRGVGKGSSRFADEVV
jgi:hypothetical protein